MDIMDEVNRTANILIEGVEEAAYVGTIQTSWLEGIRSSPEKRLKTFVPPGIEYISYPVMEKFISKIQVNLNHSVEIMVGVQVSISLLNRKMGDMPEDHTTIWCAMV